MELVERYWRGVVQRLQAEVDVFASIVEHRGEQGRENEQALARMLTSLVPQRFGLGTGLVIDRSNRFSRQTDVVLFDLIDEPRVFAQATQIMFPVEAVLACIEVKTKLSGDELNDCFTKKQSLLRLAPGRPYIDGRTHPLFVVFAYSTTLAPASIQKRILDAPPADRPDLLCVVNCGLLAGPGSAFGRTDDGAYRAGLTLLLDPQSTDIRYVPRPPTPRPQRLHPHGGHLYLAVDYDGKSILTDPARALLIFSEALLRSVSTLQGQRASVLSLYLTQRSGAVAWLPDVAPTRRHSLDRAPS